MQEYNIIEKTYKIIASERYMTLATADPSGNPWAATLFYAYDTMYNFCFLSAKDSLHAQHLNINHKAAVSIFDSHIPPEAADGVQIECSARQAKLSELPHIISIYYHRRFPDNRERAAHSHIPTDFAGITQRRFFLLTPLKIFTLDPDSRAVDRRLQVDIEALRSVLRDNTTKSA